LAIISVIASAIYVILHAIIGMISFAVKVRFNLPSKSDVSISVMAQIEGTDNFEGLPRALYATIPGVTRATFMLDGREVDWPDVQVFKDVSLGELEAGWHELRLPAKGYFRWDRGETLVKAILTVNGNKYESKTVKAPFKHLWKPA